MHYPALLLTLLLIGLAGHSKAQSDTLTRHQVLGSDLLEILDHPETKFFYTTKKIPRKMLAKAKEVSSVERHEYDGVYRMANPGKKFRHGCVKEGSLLSRRLIFVARLTDRYVLCYERGGRSHNLLISFSEINKTGTSYYNLSFNDFMPCTEYNNLDQIKLALKAERFSICYNNGGETRLPYVPF